MTLPCHTCTHWFMGCTLTGVDALQRAPGGQPGDEQTVQDWRDNHGVRAGAEGQPEAQVEPLEPCPGRKAVGGA